MAARRSKLDSAVLPLGLAPRTLFVAGKGGVGKSTVAAALALAWRDAGARTLLVEIEGQASAAATISSARIGYEPTPIGEQLSAMRITLADALKEYARMRLKIKLVADRLVNNPIIDQFTHAAPGFRDLLVLGKLWSLTRAADKHGKREWDAIVVDSPATGHGLGLLNMAGVIARMFPVGPIAAEAKSVDQFTRNAKEMGVVLVSLPEELPVTETLELREQLTRQRINVLGTVVNGLLVDRFSAAEVQQITAAQTSGKHSRAIDHALETSAWEHERCTDQAEERARLDAALGDPAGVLPFMFAEQLTREHVVSLAAWLTPAGQQQLLTQLAGAEDGPAQAAAVAAAAVEAAP